MTPAFSLYLDAVRVLAAAVVVVSHLAYARFSGGRLQFVRDLHLGSDAVVVFFVLSGLLMAFTASEGDRTLPRFAFRRATRIYSVALPAVLCTLLFDAIGRRLRPELYVEPWFAGDSLPWRALRALTFTGEIAFDQIRLGTNGPYWSLTYEVWYYALFAAAVFLKGPRRVAWLFILAVLCGPKLLLLAPAFAMGVAVHRFVRTGQAPVRTGALALALLPPVAYVVMQAQGVPGALLSATRATLGAQAVARLGFSDEFLWNAVVGLLTALHLSGVSSLVARRAAGEGPSARAIRWLAGGTFSVYLLHYPALSLCAAFLGSDPNAPVDVALLGGAVLALCLSFSMAFERTLRRQRAFVARILGSRARVGLAN